MSATITLPIDIELAGLLAKKAAAQGVKVEQFAADVLARAAQQPTIEASGMADEAIPSAIEARDGGYYISQSCVSLAAVILRFKEGLSPEAIRRECFPSLPLAKIYSAVSYYLNHQEQVENYLQQFRREEDELQQQLLMRHPEYIKTAEELRERLNTPLPK